MKTDRTWHGVRLRQIEAAADPDAPTRAVQLPTAWDDIAANALCAMVPGAGRIALPALAQSWILPLSARAKEAGVTGLADRLHAMLLRRQGAPSVGFWRGTPAEAPGFTLNLPAFHDAVAGFDVAGFGGAIDTAATALYLSTPGARSYAIVLTDLAGLLAALGLEYGGKPARDVAACLHGLLRARADLIFAGYQPDLLASVPAWPAPPSSCAVPGLAAAAAAARVTAMRCGSATPGTAMAAPGPVDALLGVETGGIAPAFTPVGPGGLTRTARAWLTARGIGLETALAAALAGEAVVPVATAADHAAMHDVVAAYVHHALPRPSGSNADSAHLREELPARRRGFTQKAAVGGHRVFLQTGEYPDGRLGEIRLSLPREGAAVRGLADSLATAVSIGLQYGAPLDAFVDALSHARFAPAGLVEGDPLVDRASSIADYVVRSLAGTYLGRAIPPDDMPLPQPAPEPPLLPLDLPRGSKPRRAALRLVSGR